MAAVAKAGAFAALLRVFVSSFPTVRADWQPVVWGLALLSLVLGAVVALIQRDVKRMMAYSSINHVGFILLGVEAATARGVSASLYYVFTYMFLVIGSFAVITVVARDGDTRSQITDYRGLARRQPAAGPGLRRPPAGPGRRPVHHRVPGQVGVVEASVAVQGYGLAVVAMASAAVAAFFYLRLAVTMYSPVGIVGRPARRRPARRGVGSRSGRPAPALPLPTGRTAPSRWPASVLTDDAPSAEVEARGAVPVPPLTAVAIGTVRGLHRGLRDHPGPGPRLRPPGHPAPAALTRAGHPAPGARSAGSVRTRGYCRRRRPRGARHGTPPEMPDRGLRKRRARKRENGTIVRIVVGLGIALVLLIAFVVGNCQRSRSTSSSSTPTSA